MKIPFFCRIFLLGMGLWFWSAKTPSLQAETSASPENQVFQFSVSGTCSEWADGSTNRGTLYLWVPEECARLRGLLILGFNVPEHRLVGHPALREACRSQSLGLVWSAHTFWNFRKEAKGQDALQVGFLEKLLGQLAEVSGYSEVKDVPWLPIGESGHLLMVDGLIEQRPEKCIAGIYLKNPGGRTNRTVPVLNSFGSAQEWGQMKKDLRTDWVENITNSYPRWVQNRASTDWPMSLLVEPATGHFYCTEEMTHYVADYVKAAVQARLPEKEGEPLRAVRLEEGYLAALPVPGGEAGAPIPYAEAKPEGKKRGWYFTRDLAERAQQMARVNWQAETALPILLAGPGYKFFPFRLNSVTQMEVSGDGTFGPRAELASVLPEGFVGAGEKLAQPPAAVRMEWICGSIAPAEDDGFRVSLDRTWRNGMDGGYLAALFDGTDKVRRAVQPIHVKLMPNQAGEKQTITWDPLPDVHAGTPPIPLTARSSAGLPVRYFVVYGPAKIVGDKLTLTPIPLRAKYPVEVAVTAWQWGRKNEPKVQTSDVIRQTFRILPP
jgi:hypothetical protein